MTKMEVRELLSSVSSVGMKEIILREGRWKVDFHDSEGAEFFTKMDNNKINYKGVVLQVFPWVFLIVWPKFGIRWRNLPIWRGKKPKMPRDLVQK